ncbi:MAG: CDP-diacylglycerol--serine O-phosphatidyltransferase [Bacteroides sp.]|nr:CDP-diacylglycerol--serine O-phosphatidyltransferase [Bacteroides sp.]
MNQLRRNIPNLVTCVNLTAGCVAIILASRASELIDGLQAWRWACIAIGVAAVADFLDGFMARLLHAYSPVGKELDSLSDLVSFGVAPAMLILHLLHTSDASWTAWTALLIPVLGAIRLARFNVDTRQTSSFIGLPIPANAIFWIGYVAMASAGYPAMLTPAVAIPAIVLESLLMVLPINLFSLKFKNYRIRGNEPRWLLIFGSAALVCFLGVPGLVWVIVLYLLLSACFHKA